MSGLGSYQAGLAAEDTVARHYARHGYTERTRRWRGPSGEIDFIAEGNGQIVFVEVKHAASHAIAATRITPAKTARLFAAGAEYLAAMELSLDTDCRIDAALVDRLGRIEVVENILA